MSISAMTVEDCKKIIRKRLGDYRYQHSVNESKCADSSSGYGFSAIQFTEVTEVSIKNPTTIRAGAVANDGALWYPIKRY